MKSTRGIRLAMPCVILASVCSCGRAPVPMSTHPTGSTNGGPDSGASLQGPGILKVRLLPPRASELTQTLVHRWVAADVVQYNVTLSAAGQNLTDVNTPATSGQGIAIFDNLRLNKTYTLSVLAMGNPGGNTNLPTQILNAVHSATSSVFFNGSNNVEDTQAVSIQVQLDPVLFSGLASTSIGPVNGTFLAPSQPATGTSQLVFAVGTYAGSDAGFQDGATDSAEFLDPTALSADGAGNLFVADTGNNRIREVDANGNVTTLSGSLPGSSDGPLASARFSGPKGIVADPSGNIYVADTGNNRIRLIQGGSVSTLAGGSAGYVDGAGASAEFQAPSGLALGPSGTLFVADTENDCIREVTSAGVVTTIAGSPAQAGLVDGKGTGALFNSPAALAYDWARQLLYVADAGNHCVRSIGPDGTVSTVAGNGTFGDLDGTGASASFDGPTGLAVDAVGDVIVADTNNNTLREIDLEGNVRTVAGSGYEGNADGTGLLAEFASPAGLAVSGNALFICDSRNSRIRTVQVEAL